MKPLSLCFSLLCILVAGCQQKIEFTAVAEPVLPDFRRASNLPAAEPDWDLAEKHERVISKLKLSNGKQPITVMQIKSGRDDAWELKLAGINPEIPISDADVLAGAFRRQATSMLIKRQNECVESLTPSAGYHSIAIDMRCFTPADTDVAKLGEFWRKDFADKLDIGTIRRNLKLSRRIQAVTGRDISRVFEERLLGEHHPYLSVEQDRAFSENLTRNKLRQLQSATASRLDWYLLIKAPHRLSKVRLTELARKVTGQMNLGQEASKTINLADIKPRRQSRTVYFINAPDSKDIKVRVGIRFPQYFVNGKPVTEDDDGWRNQQLSRFACDTLSAILGRGSYGRLFYDLRETRGLTYGAYAYCRNQALVRAMVLSGSASQEHSGAFLEGMLRHINLLKQQAPREAEVNAVRLYFLGQELINEDQDDGMGVYQLLEPGRETAKLQRLHWLRKAMPDELQNLANQYLSAEPLVVIRGDADVIADDLKQKLPDWDIRIIEQE